MANLTSNDRFTVHLRREDDGHYFIVAVLDMSTARMANILNCNDHENPGDVNVAYDLAVAYQFANLQVPTGVFNALGRRLPTDPPRRRIYTAFPWSHRTADVDNLNARFDEEYNPVANQGSMSERGDHRLIRELADKHGFPSSIEIPVVENTVLQQRITQLEQRIATLQQANTTLTADLAVERQRVATANAVVETYRNMVTPVRVRVAAAAQGNNAIRRRLDEALDDDSDDGSTE